MTRPDEAPDAGRHGVRDGIARGLSLAPGILPLGVLYGATAAAAGFSVPSVAAMSLVVFAGVAQFASVGLYREGAAAAAIVALVLVINARYLLLGTGALEMARQAGATRFQRLLVALLVVDESYALQSSQARDGRAAPSGLIAVGATILATWMVGSLTGALIGDRAPDLRVFGLDYALAGLFVGIFGIFADTRERLMFGLAAVVVGGALAYAGFGTAAAIALPAAGSLALGRWRRGGT